MHIHALLVLLSCLFVVAASFVLVFFSSGPARVGRESEVLAAVRNQLANAEAVGTKGGPRDPDLRRVVELAGGVPDVPSPAGRLETFFPATRAGDSPALSPSRHDRGNAVRAPAEHLPGANFAAEREPGLCLFVFVFLNWS